MSRALEEVCETARAFAEFPHPDRYAALKDAMIRYDQQIAVLAAELFTPSEKGDPR